MQIRSRFAVVLCTAAVAGASVSAAFAGEATGNGKNLKQEDGTLHGASACAFSGQNPEGNLPTTDPNYEPGRTQSFGQIVQGLAKQGIHIGGVPGTACNPTRATGE